MQDHNFQAHNSFLENMFCHLMLVRVAYIFITPGTQINGHHKHVPALSSIFDLCLRSRILHKYFTHISYGGLRIVF
jgi:hypothetical protein